MLNNYSKIHFANGEKLWLVHYYNTKNILHWHFECEFIRVSHGNAFIKIGNFSFHAQEGDCFFVDGEELHYMIGEPDSLIDIILFDRNIVSDLTEHHALISPKVSSDIPVKEVLQRMENLLSTKGPFYREALQNNLRGLIIDVFRQDEVTKQKESSHFYQKLIRKINDDFSFITFDDAVRYSGYSPSHFSKIFKQLSGMSFSDYLNFLKIAHAITLMRSSTPMTKTDISLACGFSTVRNFNRVFREITGYSPRTLPEDFIIDVGLRISENQSLDPTLSYEIRDICGWEGPFYW